MTDLTPVPVTFYIHPLIVAVVKPIIEKLIEPDYQGEQYRALATPWMECKFPPYQSFIGNLFRLDLIDPIITENGEMAFGAAHLSSDAYSLQLGQHHATTLGGKLRIVTDGSVGAYAGANQFHDGR
jgi:hypothetical protein